MPGDVVCAVGDLVEDVVVALPGPIHLAADTACRVSRHRGGSAANVAAVAAMLGARSRFVGRVGDDVLGDSLVARLTSTGVDVRGERGGRSGSVVVLVTPDGERTMLTDRGSAFRLTEPDAAWLDDVAVVHVPAYSLFGEPMASTANRLRRWAAERGIPATLDVSSTTLIEPVGVDGFLALVASFAPQVLFANADEAHALALHDETPVGVGTVVVKRGPHPAIVIAPDRDPVEVPVPDVEGVTDTTGAGDAFAAGFLVARLRGADEVDATVAGHAAAARVITGPGGDAWT